MPSWGTIRLDYDSVLNIDDRVGTRRSIGHARIWTSMGTDAGTPWT